MKGWRIASCIDPWVVMLGALVGSLVRLTPIRFDLLFVAVGKLTATVLISAVIVFCVRVVEAAVRELRR